MYFTENKELQRFEHDMKLVPNFARKEIWEFSDNCSECRNNSCKLDCCEKAHCPYIKRKIQTSKVNTRDLVEAFLLDNPYIPFAHRVIDILAKYKGNKLFFSKAHKMLFETAMQEINEDDYNHIACVYTLTIRPKIWEHAVHTSQGYYCMTSDLEPKDRTLISFANDLYLGTKRISLK